MNRVNQQQDDKKTEQDFDLNNYLETLKIQRKYYYSAIKHNRITKVKRCVGLLDNESNCFVLGYN